MITVTAPGKLYVAGEYAVVEPGYPAILVALNQFVKVSITPTKQLGSIISQQYQNNVLYFRRDGNKMLLDKRDNPFNFILAAIALTEQYAQSLGKRMTTYDLRIDSELDSSDGKKYGLGSSAAVTVATVKGIAQFYELHLTKAQLFKLAAIAHFSVQGNGSLGDIAASVYGGFIAYRSVDRNWLMTARNQYSLTELVNMPWVALAITPLTVPADLAFMIGWTGSPASTSRLVDAVSLSKVNHPAAYQEFLTATATCVTNMVQAFHNHDHAAILAAIKQNRALLQQLAQLSHVAIETPLLTKLCNCAEQLGGAAKSSGAGGGDCGIALIDRNATTAAQLTAKWQAAGIVPLPLKIHHIDD